MYAAPSGQRNSWTLVTRQFCSDKPTNLPPQQLTHQLVNILTLQMVTISMIRQQRWKIIYIIFWQEGLHLYQSFNKK